MSKGYVYIMTTAVDGIIKIGRSDNWTRRCQDQLEANGYKNMNGLKTYFVAKVDNQEEIESIMHDIFRESRVSNFEMFAVDKDRAKRVLSKMGEQVYPSQSKTTNTSSTRFVNTFELCDIPVGSELVLLFDTSYKVTTVDTKNKVKLPTGEVCSISYAADNYIRPKTNRKGGINGFAEFSYNGVRLWDISAKKRSKT